MALVTSRIVAMPPKKAPNFRHFSQPNTKSNKKIVSGQREEIREKKIVSDFENRSCLLAMMMVMYFIMSCYVISYHVILYHVILYHIMSCHIMLCHIISCHIILYHIISYHIVSYLIISYHIISYRLISYHIIHMNIMYASTCILLHSCT